jgi:FdhE protein
MNTSARTVAGRWTNRIARAELLTSSRPEAEETLRFYVLLASWQRDVAERLDDRLPEPAAGLTKAVPRAEYPLLRQGDLDPALLEPYLAGFMRLLDLGPAPLAALAELLRNDAPRRSQLIERFAAGQLDALAEQAGLSLEIAGFAQQVLWQPLLELLGSRALPLIDLESWYEPVCPFCGGPPLCSVLAGRGARPGQRLLVCAVCLFEWSFARLRCPECGAEDDGAFSPVEAEQYAAVRLDICARCRCYLKTADARVDGHLVAVVDDIATPALDLWADSQGLHRLAPALLR